MRTLELTADERKLLQPMGLLTAKPVLYVANVNETGFSNNPLLAALEAHASAEGAGVVAVSAALEAEIASLPEEDKGAFMQDLGLTEPGLDGLAHAAYRLLKLQTYFTVGPKEVRAWTIASATRPLRRPA